MDTAVQLGSVVARLDSLRDIDFSHEDSGKDCFVFTYGKDVAVFLTEEEAVGLLRDLDRMVGNRARIG